MNFRLRVKRHDALGRIANYPTQGVLDFYEQGHSVGVFPGMEEWKLTTGYIWERDIHAIGAPVISYRDGLDNLIWIRELGENAASGGTVVTRPQHPTPPAPLITIRPPSEQRTRSTGLAE